ncbi:MAG: hypothetical protein H8E25_09490 [Planctomycetes bacterium]|nr:hypothetical protein [Planctomycetota bacterium]
MSLNVKNSVFGLLAVLPIAVSCGPSLISDPNGAGSSASGATESTFSRQTEYEVNPSILFSGVTDATAINPNEIQVTWSDAMYFGEGQEGSAAAMSYVIFRSNTLRGTLNDDGIIAITDPGVTSFLDSGLLDNQTWFYSVVALDPDNTISNNVQVSTSRTPSEYAEGTMDVTRDILPLFNTIVDLNTGNSCTSCHSTGNAMGGLDLSTFQGLRVGIGSGNNPDSFIIPFMGDVSWSEFVSRFRSGSFFDPDSALSNHMPFLLAPDGGTPLIAGDGIIDLNLPIHNWADEGALEFPDSTPPVFEFAAVQIASLYYGEFSDFHTLSITIPHATDMPGAEPLAGEIDYVVYAGVDSNSIDWDHPVKVKTLSVNEASAQSINIDFNWNESTRLVVVVRPMDAAGRSVDIDITNYDDSDPNQVELFRQRMRNMSHQEREIIISQ